MNTGKTKNKSKKTKKPVSKTSKFFYYRIYDDKEKLNYLKTSLTHKQVEKYLKAYEKDHSKYFNPEFVEYLKKYDKRAELIEVSDISY
ncbi:MAG: hypothetical protein Kow0098_24250 [Ignavibacteriaceae bacterium]